MKLSKQQREKIKEIAQKYRLTLVLAFGSGVAGKIHSKSDIDIAVKISRFPIDFKEIADLHFELQEVFPQRELDLAIINQADPLFLKKIMESTLLLFGAPRDLAELKIYAFKRYIDHQKYFQMEKKFVKKILAERRKKIA